MQKARQNIRTKWMLEDLIHEINGGSTVGWQPPMVRAERTHWNRDRPGGHKHTDLKIKCVENVFKDEVGIACRKSIKKVNRKAQRINQNKAAREALADYEWYHETPYDSLHEQFVEEERERQRQLLCEYNGSYYMEDYEDDMSCIDWDDRLYDDILDDYYGEIH